MRYAYLAAAVAACLIAPGCATGAKVIDNMQASCFRTIKGSFGGGMTGGQVGGSYDGVCLPTGWRLIPAGAPIPLGFEVVAPTQGLPQVAVPLDPTKRPDS